MLSRLAVAARRHPQLAAVASSGVMMAAGDTVVQVGVDGRNLASIDRTRLLASTSFAMVYLGVVQYRIYLHIFDKFLSPQRLGKASPVIKAAVDNFVVTPGIYVE